MGRGGSVSGRHASQLKGPMAGARTYYADILPAIYHVCGITALHIICFFLVVCVSLPGGAGGGLYKLHQVVDRLAFVLAAYHQ